MKRSSSFYCHSARAFLRPSGVRLQRKKVVIPPLTPSANLISSSAGHSSRYEEYNAHRYPHPETAAYLDEDGAASLQRQRQVDAFKDATDGMLEQVWRDSKPHLRRQEELIKTFGVDGAVAETLQPTNTSFGEELRQRPLDRAILEEIYHGLHGRRIERKLKKGVSWEHWITKGDGTAPVYNTSAKAQQTFAFGGQIQQVRCATHPQHFPILVRPGAAAAAAAEGTERKQSRSSASSSSRRRRVDRQDLIPEVAFIGRTSSGKSSLINALINATVTPYGHLQGTTSSVRFYSVADKLVLVDCPGYGHYNPLQTPALDAENAIKCMRAYLRCGARTHPKEKKAKKGPHTVASVSSDDVGGAEEDEATEAGHDAASSPTPLVYQPRNLKRVFVCVPARGMQHTDLAYCQLLEDYGIPFTVVLTKTDAAPIRFLARLTDHTRSQLVKYKQCKELMLASSLRLAGIDKIQTLLGSMALEKDKFNGATMDFSSIV